MSWRRWDKFWLKGSKVGFEPTLKNAAPCTNVFFEAFASDMDKTVKQQEFLKSIKHLSASEVADLIRRTDPEVLNACKPKIISLYRQVYRFSGGGNGRAEDPMMLDEDAAVVALIKTACLADILKLKRFPIPFWAPVSVFF